jgi:hypothetical protein
MTTTPRPDSGLSTIVAWDTGRFPTTSMIEGLRRSGQGERILKIVGLFDSEEKERTLTTGLMRSGIKSFPSK